MDNALEQKVKKRLQESIDSLVEELPNPILAELLLIDYVTVLAESQGYGTIFKLSPLAKIVETLGYKRSLYRSHFQHARDLINKELHMLDELPDQSPSHKTLGYDYQLPKDGSELKRLKDWYAQRLIDLKAQEAQVKKEKKPVIEEVILPPLFTKDKYDIFYGSLENDAIVWSKDHYDETNKSASIFVAFVNKGEALGNEKDKPLESMLLKDLPENTFYFAGIEQHEKAIAYGKHERSPIIYEIYSETFRTFMEIMTNFNSYDTTGIPDWMREGL